MSAPSSHSSAASSAPSTFADPAAREGLVAADSESPEQHISGHWRYASGSAGRERIHDAIDSATSKMAPFSAQIARRRLKQELAPAQELMLAVEDGHVSFELEQMSIHGVPLGRWTSWSLGPTEYEVRFTLLDNGELIQELRSDKTRMRRLYQVNEDGDLNVHFRLSDERLPDKLTFWLRYDGKTTSGAS